MKIAIHVYVNKIAYLITSHSNNSNNQIDKTNGSPTVENIHIEKNGDKMWQF